MIIFLHRYIKVYAHNYNINTVYYYTPHQVQQIIPPCAIGYNQGIVKEVSGVTAVIAATNTSLFCIAVHSVSGLPHVMADIASASALSSNVTAILPTAMGEPVTN